jgi:hypothetical protein
MRVLLVAAALCAAACTTVPETKTLALQCVTGSAQWSPIAVDLTHSLINGNPAIVTASEIQWETTTRNWSGGATQTKYQVNRSQGTITVDNFYVGPNGNGAAETNHYAGECHARYQPL